MPPAEVDHDSVKLKDIHTANPVQIAPDAPLDEAIARMDEAGVRHLPVVENGRFVGMVSNRDLLEATGWLPARMRVRWQSADEVERALVREVMHSPTMVAAPDDDVLAIAAEAVAEGSGCLPVLDGECLTGIVTEHDLLRAFLHRPPKEDVAVESFMTREVRTIRADQTIGEAREAMDDHGLRHLPVVGEGGLVGILSDRDLRRETGRGRGPDALVRTAMSLSPVSVAPTAPLIEAARTMVERHIDALPVVDSASVLVGILTTIDVLDPCVRALNSET